MKNPQLERQGQQGLRPNLSQACARMLPPAQSPSLMELVIFDLETTGFSPRHHEISGNGNYRVKPALQSSLSFRGGD